MSTDEARLRTSVLFNMTRQRLHEIDKRDGQHLPVDVYLHLGYLHGMIGKLINDIDRQSNDNDNDK